MLRIALIAAAALAVCSVAMADEQEDAARLELDVRQDGFVVSGDECGASRYSHLLGENYAELYEAALVPDDSAVVNRAMLRTLEYTPGRLNIILDGAGRVQAIGCF
jgi:hypothetical protein